MYQENPRGPRHREKVTLDSSMCHVWPDIVVRGVGGTAVLRTRQLVKDARPVSVLAYNGGSSNHMKCGVFLTLTTFWDFRGKNRRK